MQKPATPAAPVSTRYYVNTYSMATIVAMMFLAASAGSFLGNMAASLLREENESAPARCECTHIYMGEATIRARRVS